MAHGTIPEDELVADLLEELWRVALLPLDKLDDLEPGPALRLALLVLGVAPEEEKDDVRPTTLLGWIRKITWGKDY